MKRYKMIGLMGVVMGWSILPSLAWVGDSARSNAVTSSAVAASSFSGSGFQGNRDRDRNRNNRNNRNNQGSVIVVTTPNNDVNNGNYLGLPPWYRLNYYTPWMSDWENGTAYQNVPTSHAAAGYAYPGPTGPTNAPQMQTPGMPPVGMGVPPPGVNQGSAPESPDFVVAVQRELRRRGFYNGVANGVSDAATRAAIRGFERNQGLPITGVIGMPLMKALGFM